MVLLDVERSIATCIAMYVMFTLLAWDEVHVDSRRQDFEHARATAHS